LLNTEELTRIINAVHVHIKVLLRLPDIRLDMNAVSRRFWAPSSRRELVLIPAKDLACDYILHDQLIRNESRNIAPRAHQTVAAAELGVFFPSARLKESRARIEEIGLRKRK